MYAVPSSILRLTRGAPPRNFAIYLCRSLGFMRDSPYRRQILGSRIIQIHRRVVLFQHLSIPIDDLRTYTFGTK